MAVCGGGGREGGREREGEGGRGREGDREGWRERRGEMEMGREREGWEMEKGGVREGGSEGREPNQPHHVCGSHHHLRCLSSILWGRSTLPGRSAPGEYSP